jgi:Ca-activated chloride channel homolog
MFSSKQLMMVLMTASALFADGFIIFPSPNPTPLYIKYHKVRCTIDNGVATTVIDQEFVNPLTDALANGKYVFPVPRGAVITGFSVVVDGTARTATVMDKTEARSFFTSAIKNSTLASLLEYTGNAAYSLEIGSIAPAASRRVQISYVEVLPKIDGLSRYLYPLNTEKYSMRLIDTVSITVAISNSASITSVFSPSYPLTVERTGTTAVTAAYRSAKSRPDRDFELFYKVSDSALSFHLFAQKQGPEDGYFLMLMTPRFVEKSSSDRIIPKEMAFTIDHSGSMGGVKLQQAKDALTFCLNRLMPDDFFNIVVFDNTITTNAQEMLPATGENVHTAQSFVQSIAEGGSTDIAQALTTSLSCISRSQQPQPHYLVFLTDGLPTSGVTDISQICAQVNNANSTRARLFSVGFGYDVNTVLLDKLSLDNNGYPLYCDPGQNIEEVIGTLYKQIEAPLLTSPSLTITSAGNAVSTCGISPEKLPDLFVGSEIAVYGRYHGHGNATVTLSGTTDSSADTMVFQASFPDSIIDYPFVPRLWATQHIARLMTRIKLQTLTQESLTPLVDSVKLLSLAYGIVTPYTSQLFVSQGGVSWTGNLQTTNGKSANDASNAMQGMQQNSNAAQTVVADTNAVPYAVAPQTNQIQNAGNKVFVYSPTRIWIDASFDSTKPADTIIYGSDAYFELAVQSKELTDLLAVGNQTAFNYQGKNYLVLDNNVSAAITPGNSLKPAAAGAAGFSVGRKGAQIVFSVPSDRIGGTITVYSVKGSAIMKLPVVSALTTVDLGDDGGASILLPNGAYLAIYRNKNIVQSVKFMRMQ